MRISCVLFALLILVVSCRSGNDNVPASTSFGQSISALQGAVNSLAYVLVDESSTQEEKSTSENMLRYGGKESVSALMNYINDNRVYSKQVDTPSGALGDNPVDLSIADVAKDIIYSIACGGKRERRVRIVDWNRWWAEVGYMSIDDLVQHTRSEYMK